MNIYLTGFMAAGKSTLAKKLAKKLNMPCIDLDSDIEQFCGKSISRIFAGDGENTFRKTESRRLVYYSKKPEDYVIACGGGIIEDKQNLYTMQEYGVVVFVDTSIDVIKNRLSEEKVKRPLLKHAGGKNLDNLIDKLYESRVVKYKKADVIYQPGSESTDGLITKIGLYTQGEW
ncbi:MAG: shikimate kinase [Bacteroidota bacterium]